MDRKHPGKAIVQLDDPALELDVLINMWPMTIEVFLRYEMFCVGCIVNQFHTVAEACAVYNLDEAQFRKDLKHVISKHHL